MSTACGGKSCRGLLKAAAKTEGHIDSVGVDGWGVDYACLMPTAIALAMPFAIATPATCPPWRRRFLQGSQERCTKSPEFSFCPFNTIYQLVAHVAEFPDEWERATRWLTLPEYFQYRLTGVAAEEYTEASTTQLLDVRTKSWSKELASALGLSLENSRPSCKPARCWENCARKSARKWV
jgi:rhamnulokinase